MDDSGADVDDGFSPEEIDAQVGDGDVDHHDDAVVDVGDDLDDSHVEGDVPNNIIRSARGPRVSPIITMPTLGRPGR